MRFSSGITEGDHVFSRVPLRRKDVPSENRYTDDEVQA